MQDLGANPKEGKQSRAFRPCTARAAAGWCDMSLRERLAAYELAASSTPETTAPSSPEPVTSALGVKKLSSIYTLSSRRSSTDGSDAVAEDEAGSDVALLEYRPLVDRVTAHDPSLSWLDLTGNRLLLALSSAQKSEVVSELARGTVLTTLILNSLGFDNANAEAVGDLLRQTKTLQGLSLEGNAITEDGLLQIASALRGHPSITELSVANQKRPLPTAAITQLLKAMEATPTLVHLGLGTLRDDAVRKRHQAA